MTIPALSEQEFIDLLVGNLPRGWFSVEDRAPGGATYITLHGAAKNDYTVYQKAIVAQRRGRITTAAGVELDDIATDFFGSTFMRYTNESDSNYRTRLVHRLFNPIGTTAGIVAIVTETLGTVPVVYTRANQIAASGGYNHDRNVNSLVPTYPCGGYSNGVNPYGGFFAYGVPQSCWAHPQGPYTGEGGQFGYNESGVYLLDIGAYQGLVTVQQPEPDDDHFLTFRQIMALITSLKPYATVAWVRVNGPTSTGGVPIM